MKKFNDLKFALKLFIFAGIMITAMLIMTATTIICGKVTSSKMKKYELVANTNDWFHVLEIDHLQWVGTIEDMFIGNMEAFDLQLDPTKCNLGKFIYGDSKEIVNAFPEFKEHIKGIEEPHRLLHESAHLLLENWKQVHPGLKATLCSRLDDHRVWVENVSAALLAGNFIDVQMDPNLCSFGKWLESKDVENLKKTWPEFRQAIESIIPHHNALHESANTINSADTHEQKVAIFNSITRKSIQEVASLFEELQELEDTLVNSQRKTLQLFENVTHVHLDDTRKELKEVDRVLNLKKNEIHEDLENTLIKVKYVNMGIALFAITLSIIIGTILIRIVTSPLQKCKEFAAVLATGDFTVQLDIDQKDEIGVLSKVLNHMVAELRSGFREIKEGVQSMASSTTELSAISTQLSGNAEQSSQVSSSVATASEQTSHNMTTVSASVEEMSTNLRSLATASEEMTATIEEIAKNTERGRIVTQTAVTKVSSASKQMNELGQAAKLIGNITDTIKGISEQTNLLALNATIEAASAGEAGKGFSVVANEIKELSRQTAKATEQISESINNIQQTTDISITEISGIVSVIEEIDQITSMIASSVEEQSNTSTEIANNISQTADGVQEISANVGQVNLVSNDVAKDVNQVNQTSNEIAAASVQLNTSANELSEFAEKLNEISSKYKV